MIHYGCLTEISLAEGTLHERSNSVANLSLQEISIKSLALIRTTFHVQVLYILIELGMNLNKVPPREEYCEGGDET